MGATENAKMSVLTSRADRRTILVFGENEICAEPSPDVAEAVYSQVAAELAAKGLNVGANRTLQTAVMQLTRRSQGLQFYRDHFFMLCIARYNGDMDQDEFLADFRAARAEAVEMIKAEIEHLPAIATAILEVSKPQAGKVEVDPISSSDEEEEEEEDQGNQDEENNEEAQAST